MSNLFGADADRDRNLFELTKAAVRDYQRRATGPLSRAELARGKRLLQDLRERKLSAADPWKRKNLTSKETRALDKLCAEIDDLTASFAKTMAAAIEATEKDLARSGGGSTAPGAQKGRFTLRSRTLQSRLDSLLSLWSERDELRNAINVFRQNVILEATRPGPQEVLEGLWQAGKEDPALAAFLDELLVIKDTQKGSRYAAREKGPMKIGEKSIPPDLVLENKQNIARQVRAQSGEDLASGLAMIDKLRRLRDENRSRYAELSPLRDAREILTLDRQLKEIDQLIADLSRKYDLGDTTKAVEARIVVDGARAFQAEAETAVLTLESLTLKANDAAMRQLFGDAAGKIRLRLGVTAEGPSGEVAKCALGETARRTFAGNALAQIESLLGETTAPSVREVLADVVQRLRSR